MIIDTISSLRRCQIISESLASHQIKSWYLWVMATYHRGGNLNSITFSASTIFRRIWSKIVEFHT